MLLLVNFLISANAHEFVAWVRFQFLLGVAALPRRPSLSTRLRHST